MCLRPWMTLGEKYCWDLCPFHINLSPLTIKAPQTPCLSSPSCLPWPTLSPLTPCLTWTPFGLDLLRSSKTSKPLWAQVLVGLDTIVLIACSQQNVTQGGLILIDVFSHYPPKSAHGRLVQLVSLCCWYWVSPLKIYHDHGTWCRT